MDKSALIELVQSERALWDQRDKNYHNLDIKPSLWAKVGEALNIPDMCFIYN